MPNQIINNKSTHDRDNYKITGLSGNNLNTHKSYCKSVYKQQRSKKQEIRDCLNYQVKCTEPKNSSFDTQTRLKYVLARRLMKNNDTFTLKIVKRLFTEIYNLQSTHRGVDHPRTVNAQLELIKLSKRIS